MRVLRTLYVTEHTARLRVSKHNLVVDQGTETKRIPIETVEAVVLTGRAEVTNHALGELVSRGIRIAAVSKGGRLRFCVTGASKGNVLLRLAQFENATSLSTCLEIAKVFVAGKLQNSRRMMTRWAADSRDAIVREVIEADVRTLGDRLSALATAGDGDTVRGIEGDGARRYFRAMAMHLGVKNPMLAFERRTRRPPRDPVNALLSFTYGILLTEIVGALEAVGLDPQVGYLHRPRPGRASLALDLLEEFRPSVADRFVVSSLGRGQLDLDDMEIRAGGGVYLTEEGRRRHLALYDEYRQREVTHPLLDRRVPVALLPMIQATILARYLRGDIASYAPYTLVS